MKYSIVALLFLLSACTTIDTDYDAFDAVYSGAAAVIANDGASEKCKQGHAQDRVNCRKKKKEQIVALSEAINKHSKK